MVQNSVGWGSTWWTSNETNEIKESRAIPSLTSVLSEFKVKKFVRRKKKEGSTQRVPSVRKSLSFFKNFCSVTHRNTSVKDATYKNKKNEQKEKGIAYLHWRVKWGVDWNFPQSSNASAQFSHGRWSAVHSRNTDGGASRRRKKPTGSTGQGWN